MNTKLDNPQIQPWKAVRQNPRKNVVLEEIQTELFSLKTYKDFDTIIYLQVKDREGILNYFSWNESYIRISI